MDKGQEKKKRKAYSAHQKIEVCELAEKIGNRAAARLHFVDEKSVREWKRDLPKLKTMKKTRKSLRHGLPKWHDFETDLRQWILDKRAQKHRVTTTLVKLQARVMSQEYGLTDCKCSNGWFERFKKRAGLSVRFRTSVGQAPPTDYAEKVELFKVFIAEKIGTNKIQPENIFNMDEVPCSFDLPGTRTLDLKGKEDISIVTTGAEKANFTVVLGVSGTGEKLTPMVIFKRKTMPKEKLPNEIIVKVNPKGWMNSDLMAEWLKSVLLSRKSVFFAKPKPSQSLLIYDACRAHLKDELKECVAKYSELAVIPGGLTKFLQPLDISVNKSFKDKLRVLWDQWILDDMKATFTKGGNRRRASIAEVCQWIIKAWREITPATIKNGFKKAGILNYDTESGPEDAFVIEEPDQSSDQEGQLVNNDEDIDTSELIEIDDDDNLDLLGDEFDGWDSIDDLDSD